MKNFKTLTLKDKQKTSKSFKTLNIINKTLEDILLKCVLLFFSYF